MITCVNRRCAVPDLGYTGETCLDGFTIPEAHLEGLYLYDGSNPDPVQVIRPEGAGVSNVDYILYVTSATTPSCYSSNIIASATYCQLDQNGRPISGYINFCPSALQDPLYNRAKAEKVD